MEWRPFVVREDLTPIYNGVGVVKNFSSTPLVLRAGSGVKGGPTVFVGSSSPPLARSAAHLPGLWQGNDHPRKGGVL
jgi:hypothetical protein